MRQSSQGLTGFAESVAREFVLGACDVLTESAREPSRRSVW